MNRTFIGLIGAAVLGALTACSGQGDEWSDDFDTQAQRLTAYDNAVATAQFPASCVINGNMLVAGGYDASGNAIPDVALFDPDDGAGGSWTSKRPLNEAGAGFDEGVPVGEAKMIAIPGTDQCVLFGGRQLAGANAETQVMLYDLSADTWTVKTSMPVSRAEFEISVCGTQTGGNTDILMFGGRSGANFRTQIDKYDLSDTWTASFATLNTARAYPAVAPLVANPNDGTNRFKRFVVAGGDNSGSPVATFELLDVDANCANPTLRIGHDGTNPLQLALARKQAVAFREDDSADTFQVCGGELSTGVITGTCEKLTVSNWTAAANAVNASVTLSGSNPGGAPMNVARALARLVPGDDTATRFTIWGGRGVNGDSVVTSQTWDTTGTPRFEKFDGTAGTDSITGVYGNALEYLDGVDDAISATGLKITSGVVQLLSTTEGLP